MTGTEVTSVLPESYNPTVTGLEAETFPVTVPSVGADVVVTIGVAKGVGVSLVDGSVGVTVGG